MDIDKPHPIIDGPHNYQLIEFYWHLSPDDFYSTYLDLKLIKGGLTKKIRFYNPIQVQIDEGFSGNICGMEIIDVRHQQLDNIGIEVRNFEQDPGITFKAKNVVEIE